MKEKFLTIFFTFLVFFAIMIPQFLISKYIFCLKFNESLMWGVTFIAFYFTTQHILPKILKKNI